MKKLSFLTSLIVIIYTNTVSAMGGGQPPIDHIGINTFNEMCHITTDIEEFMYKGGARTQLIENKNFLLATCKAEYPQDPDMINEIVERADTPCVIGVENPTFDSGTDSPKDKIIRHHGSGGFTITPSGNAAGFCKVIK